MFLSTVFDAEDDGVVNFQFHGRFHDKNYTRNENCGGGLVIKSPLTKIPISDNYNESEAESRTIKTVIKRSTQRRCRIIAISNSSFEGDFDDHEFLKNLEL